MLLLTIQVYLHSFSPVVPNHGEISPRGKFWCSRGNSGHVGNINIAVNVALIIIHVSSLIFLNNSWNLSNSINEQI